MTIPRYNDPLTRRRERTRVASRSLVTEKLTDEPSDAQTILGVEIDTTLALEGQVLTARGDRLTYESPSASTEGGVAGSHATEHAEGGSDDLVNQNVNVRRLKIEDTDGSPVGDGIIRVRAGEVQFRNATEILPAPISASQNIFRSSFGGAIVSRMQPGTTGTDSVDIKNGADTGYGHLRLAQPRIQERAEFTAITAPAGDPAANQGWLYGKDVSGQVHPFWEQGDGTVTDLTAGGGGGGHTIEENGTPLTARTVLNFQDGVIASDDGTETDVNVDYAGTAEIADVAPTEAAGTSVKVPRGDHVHAHTAAQHTALALYSIVPYVFFPDEAPDQDIDAGVQSMYLHSGPANEILAGASRGDCVVAAGTAFTAVFEYGDTDDLDTVATWTTIVTVTMGTDKSQLNNSSGGTIPANRLLRLNITTVSGSAPRGATFSMLVKRPLST